MEPDEPEDPRDAPPGGLAGHLRIYLRDSSLWPVLVVVLAVGTTFGASALLLAVRDRNGFALAIVAIAAIVSVELCLREWRGGGFGATSGIVAVVWSLCAAAAATVIGLGGY